MKLTASGHYAVAAVLDLARLASDRPTSLHSVAKRQSISLPFLEQIFFELKKNGVVTSFRGPGGGYKLARSVDAISIADILESVGSTINTTRCKGQENCQNGHKCPSHDLWMEVKKHMDQFLSGITVGQLLTNSTPFIQPHTITSLHKEQNI